MTRAEKIEKWRASHQEHIKEYRKEYYAKYPHGKPIEEESGVLRECPCGVVAITEEDLELFVKDTHSKHGRRSKCLVCSSKESRKGAPKAKPRRTCPKCRTTFTGELDIEKGFRRTPPSRDRVVGGLALHCKECEFPEELYFNIDGKYIPKGDLPSLHNNPIEVI